MPGQKRRAVPSAAAPASKRGQVKVAAAVAAALADAIARHRAAKASRAAEAAREAATCSVCSDVFEMPITAPCGHSFCCACAQDCDNRCALCRGELVPYSARQRRYDDPFKSAAAAVIAEWPESVALRALCDAVRAEEAPLSSGDAAARLLRHLRGKPVLAYARKLAARVSAADAEGTADRQRRSLKWWTTRLVFKINLPALDSRACAEGALDVDETSPLYNIGAFTGNSSTQKMGGDFSWGADELRRCLQKLPAESKKSGALRADVSALLAHLLEKAKEAEVFEQMNDDDESLGLASIGERLMVLMQEVPALSGFVDSRYLLRQLLCKAIGEAVVNRAENV